MLKLLPKTNTKVKKIFWIDANNEVPNGFSTVLVKVSIPGYPERYFYRTGIYNHTLFNWDLFDSSNIKFDIIEWAYIE